MRRLGRYLSLAAAARRGTAKDGLPYKLTLILSSRCPTRCTFCSIWRNPQEGELTPEEWGRFFSSSRHAAWTNLSGGEIFQRADLPAILDELAKGLPRLCLVTFPTTGYFPDRLVEGCERLVRAGVPKVLVTISLDGPPATHDRRRGREGAHARACEAMRALRTARLPRVEAYFGMTLLPENHHEADAAVRAAAEVVPGIGPGDFHFNLGMESGHYYRNLGSGVRAPAEALAAMQRHRRRGWSPVSLLERAYQRRVGRYLATGRSPVPCSALRASVFVDSKGVVYPCSIYDRPLGSLRENGFDLGRVLRGAEARAARADVVADRCPGCWTPCDAYPSLLTSLVSRPDR
ncbi:MAG TPA: radical SAM protein [Planctomycetota bacterium]|nr:radical SAM protein [Planctomycetota bacterium]